VLSKNEIIQTLDIVYGIAAFIFSRALAKFSIIKTEWKEMKKKQIIQEQSLKRLWEKMDSIKPTK
jgi:hypothetical protein